MIPSDEPKKDQHLLDQLKDLRALLDVAEALEEVEGAQPGAREDPRGILGCDFTPGEPLAGVIEAVRAAQVGNLAQDVEHARQQLTDQGLDPLPGESTQEFIHRGPNTMGYGLTGPEADALRQATEEDARDFLRRVGPVPMTQPAPNTYMAANEPGEWTNALDSRELAEVRFSKLYARDFGHGTAGHNRLMVIAKLADMLDSGDPAKPPPDPLTITRHRLDVQYHSQHEYDAQLTRRDCGPACVEMLGEFLRPAVDHSTDEIMVRITQGVDRSTYISELQKAALEMFQVTLHRVEHCSMFQLRDWILEDKPVIILVHYGAFHTRLDQNYRAGHFMVVVGYEVMDYQGTPSTRFLVHDPDYYQVRTNGDTLNLLDQGAFIPVTEAHLNAMWSDSIKDRNPIRMALVPEIM